MSAKYLGKTYLKNNKNPIKTEEALSFSIARKKLMISAANK
jgi:hypothetical protein